MEQEMRMRNYSERTITCYICLLRQVSRHLHKNPGNLSIQEIKDYLYWRITEHKISTSTINQTIGAFKLLFEDVLGKQWDSLKIKRPKREKKLPIVLSKDEICAIIQSATNSKHKAILALTYSTGLRLNEVACLTRNDIDPSRMTIHVRQGKGKKSRYTVLSPKVYELLKIYYEKETPKHYVFENMYKKGKALSDRTYQNIFKNNVKKARIDKHISFHTLRHTYATHSLEDGMNLRLLQSRMGHTTMKTTACYLHISQIKASDNITPIDNLDI